MADYTTPAKDSTSNPVDTTPEQFETPKDARKEKDAGVYPLYYSHKSRSGHVFNMDDSPGAESVKVQHRSGSSIQMMPDGQVVFHNKKGKYEVTFGENRMVVTGAQDIVVQGGGSLKVDGDYNMTVRGNMNYECDGDFNATYKNYNMAVRGNMDTGVLGNQTTKVEGNTEHASEGRTVITADGGLGIASSSDSVGIESGAEFAIKAANKVMVQSGGDTSIKAGGQIVSDGSAQYHQSGKSVAAAFTYTKDA